MQPIIHVSGVAHVLELEDGSRVDGFGFGAGTLVSGEVVFNTAMSGYVEALTDPSYRGQILVLTYPLVGNYGVPASRAPGSLDQPYESDRIQPSGLVVQCYSAAYSHHQARRSLAEWLIAEGVPAITGIDTRTLTKRLRERGTMLGWIYPKGVDPAHARASASSVDMRRKVFFDVTPREAVTYAGGDLRVLLVDCGAKDHIVRSLRERGATVIRVPWYFQLDKYARTADAVLIGNGPGDPANLGGLANALRSMLDWFHGPIVGVCLGHQILARAAGADTYKLPYGHRGVNHPVRDVETNRCYITSQNHGYAVDERTLPSDWRPSFVNLNDGTNEGIRSRLKPHWSVQFHPEATPGPHDTAFLFDDFLAQAHSMRRLA